MTHYLLRRLMYALPILIGVNLITFLLFFVVNSVDDMARVHLGDKHVTEEAIVQWKAARGYDLPLFYNEQATGWGAIDKTLFYQKSTELFKFNFGVSDAGRDIGHDIWVRMWPSLALAVPALVFGMAANIFCAMILAFFRASYLDLWGMVICIVLMSISGLFYIIGGQFLLGKLLQLVPISGYGEGLSAFKFIALPVFIGVIAGIGSGTRWYRTIFLEQMELDYVRTARAKGLSEARILFRHVLSNAMIPILTGVVVVIPSLFMGSLIMESFFAIPGLGSYTIDAISQQDFAIVRAMVFLGSVLYLIGLWLTDISYTLVDPRVRLE